MLQFSRYTTHKMYELAHLALEDPLGCMLDTYGRDAKYGYITSWVSTHLHQQPCSCQLTEWWLVYQPLQVYTACSLSNTKNSKTFPVPPHVTVYSSCRILPLLVLYNTRLHQNTSFHLQINHCIPAIFLVFTAPATSLWESIVYRSSC